MRAARAARKELGFLPPGRAIEVRSTDTFVVSYPRSGNTWMRFLLGHIVRPGIELDLKSIEDVIPGIYVNSQRRLSRLPDPRTLKSHEPFDPRYGRVIYIVRDPRRVVTSSYRLHRRYRRIPDGYPMSLYVDRFVRGDINPYGTWAEHVGSWTGARGGTESFHLVRYEDVVRSAPDVLMELCDFLGLDRSRDAVERAVELSSLERLQSLERSQGAQWRAERQPRLDVPFFGSDGKVDLTDDEQHRIAEAFASRMTTLGYA
jgi:hypothetical protein